MTRAATSILGGVLACLLLVGCTGADPVETDASSTPEAAPSASVSAESASPSPTPSPTPTVEPPERPAALDDDGAEGAKAAAEYFMLLDTYIMKTNDTRVFNKMSHKMCEWCQKRMDQAKEIEEKGYTWTGGVSKADVAQLYDRDDATLIWPVDVRVRQLEVRVVDQNGETVYEDEQSTDTAWLEIIRAKDTWVVVGLGVEEESGS